MCEYEYTFWLSYPGRAALGPFGLVHRLSNLGGILSYVRVGEGAITGLVDRVLLFLALAFQPSIV